VKTWLDNGAWVFFVLNPAAGGANPEALSDAIRQRCESSEIRYEIHFTQEDENLKSVVQEAVNRGASLVVALGGDGTVSGVANGLVDEAVPLGIIPTGTGNVLAREFNIPLDPQEALEVIISSKNKRSIDLMQVGEDFYMLNIGVGVTSKTIRGTQRADKRRFGILAYLWEGLKHLMGSQPTRFLLKIDHRSVSTRASEIMITNSSLFGMEPFHWDTDIEPDDGKIDLCIVRARNLVDYVKVGWGMLPGQRDRRPNVKCLRFEKGLSLESTPSLPVQADGELIGSTPLELNVRPQVLRVLVPDASPD